MESALKKTELERQEEIPVVGDSAGIQERYMQDGDEHLKPHLYTVNYTAAEQGLAQYSRTSASPKRQFGCAHLILERLMTRTWPDCASWLPDLGMKLQKREPKSQKARIATHLRHGAAAPSYSGLPASTQIAQLWGLGVLWGFLRSGDKASMPKALISEEIHVSYIVSRSGRGLVLGGHMDKSVG